MSRHERHSDGIYYQHTASCGGSKSSGRCRCRPKFQASIYVARSGRRLKKTFATISEAKTWRAEMTAAAKLGGSIPGTSRITVSEALDELIAGMKDGTILNRSFREYKPSTTRSYERAAGRVRLALGAVRLTNLTRRDLKAFAAQLAEEGHKPSTVRNIFDPIRVICRRAFDDEIITIDPTMKLQLPPSRGKRERTVSPAEAEALIDAAPAEYRALWAAAIYIGLRRGELQALRWEDLDLDRGVGRCRRAWDDEGGDVLDPKTEAGVRMFPIVKRLRKRLIAHKLATGRSGNDLVFGRTASKRFVPSTIGRHARDAWAAAGLEPITLHDGRHSAATLGSYAGIGDLELTHIMGHSSVLVTKDIYGHMREEQVELVTRTLDAYLQADAQEGAGR